LTRAERQKRITVGEAESLWQGVLLARPRLVPYLPLMTKAIQISSSIRIGIYDCLYVALAERENCEFVTADDKILKNLKSQYPFIVSLASLP
jgi:predicted nucleic acid-binding protein